MGASYVLLGSEERRAPRKIDFVSPIVACDQVEKKSLCEAIDAGEEWTLIGKNHRKTLRSGFKNKRRTLNESSRRITALNCPNVTKTVFGQLQTSGYAAERQWAPALGLDPDKTEHFLRVWAEHSTAMFEAVMQKIQPHIAWEREWERDFRQNLNATDSLRPEARLTGKIGDDLMNAACSLKLARRIRGVVASDCGENGNKGFDLPGVQSRPQVSAVQTDSNCSSEEYVAICGRHRDRLGESQRPHPPSIHQQRFMLTLPEFFGPQSYGIFSSSIRAG
jgi:hypothetical protein